MSIAASALSCALEVREAQVAPEPAAEHDDAAASLSSCETAAFGVQVRLRQRRLGGRRPRRRCYLVGTRDGSPPPCGCGPSVLFVGTLYQLNRDKAIFSSRRRYSASRARSDASVLFTGTIQDIGKL